MLKLIDDAVVWREIDGGILLLDLRRSTFLGANAPATVLWRLLAAGTDRTSLIAALVDAFGSPEAAAAEDVDGFLTDCFECDLLEVAPETAAAGQST